MLGCPLAVGLWGVVRPGVPPPVHKALQGLEGSQDDRVGVRV